MRSSILTTVLTIVCSASAVNAPWPGDKQSDDAYCSFYADCGTDGLKYWNTLHTTLSQANPVDNFPDGRAIFQQYYGAAPSEQPNPMKRIRQDLVNHGFDISLLTGWSTMSKDQQTGMLETDPMPAYDNDFDTRNGLLVASANFREWDSQRQLPWSELMFQTWPIVQAAQGGGPISNLKVVIRKEIENQGTQEVLRTMYKARGLTMNQGDPNWYPCNEDQHRYFFHALIGTDNVKGVVWLLNDHPNAMGKKEIINMWTRWTERDPDIWINIGHRCMPGLQCQQDERTSNSKVMATAENRGKRRTNMLEGHGADFPMEMLINSTLRDRVPQSPNDQSDSKNHQHRWNRVRSSEKLEPTDSSIAATGSISTLTSTDEHDPGGPRRCVTKAL